MWHPDTNEIFTAYSERWSHETSTRNEIEFNAWLESVRKEAKIEAFEEAKQGLVNLDVAEDLGDVSVKEVIEFYLNNCIYRAENVKGIQSE